MTAEEELVAKIHAGMLEHLPHGALLAVVREILGRMTNDQSAAALYVFVQDYQARLRRRAMH